MDKRKVSLTFAALMLTLGLLFGLVAAPQVPVAIGAPSAAPTPVSNASANPPARIVTYWTNQRLTATTGASTAQSTYNAQKCDLSWDIDVTAANAITLTLQFSNDGTYWNSGPIFATNISADSGRSTTGSANMQQYAIFGRYSRVYAVITNSSAITPTVIGVCK